MIFIQETRQPNSTYKQYHINGQIIASTLSKRGGGVFLTKNNRTSPFDCAVDAEMAIQRYADKIAGEKCYFNPIRPFRFSRIGKMIFA